MIKSFEIQMIIII